MLAPQQEHLHRCRHTHPPEWNNGRCQVLTQVIFRFSAHVLPDCVGYAEHHQAYQTDKKPYRVSTEQLFYFRVCRTDGKNWSNHAVVPFGGTPYCAIDSFSISSAKTLITAVSTPFIAGRSTGFAAACSVQIRENASTGYRRRGLLLSQCSERLPRPAFPDVGLCVCILTGAAHYPNTKCQITVLRNCLLLKLATIFLYIASLVRIINSGCITSGAIPDYIRSLTQRRTASFISVTSETASIFPSSDSSPVKVYFNTISHRLPLRTRKRQIFTTTFRVRKHALNVEY